MTEKQRNMAIGAITFMVGNGYFVDAPETEDALNETIKTLAEMEEELERNKGEWKRNITAERDAQLIFTKVYNCSECGYESVGNNLKNYCPNCGADMRGD